MQENQEMLIKLCRRKLRKIAWRIQYRARKQSAKELLVSEELTAIVDEVDVVSNLYVQELLGKIPSSKGQCIIRKLLIDGLTEKEVASSLNMSQQGVNKWKKKGIQILNEHLRSF